jgi:hypothetical protein
MDDILQGTRNTQPPTTRRLQSKTKCKGKTDSQMRESFFVVTNFDLWVERVKAKRTIDYNAAAETLKKWPHKSINASKKKMQRAVNPRF